MAALRPHFARDNALVLATHGRSIWVLDDLSPLERASESILTSDVHLFDLAPATHFRLYGRKGNTGHKWFAAPNPPYGAVINYYVKDKPKDDVKITIMDASGAVVRDLKGPKEAGLNRIVWDLRLNGSTPTARTRRRRWRFLWRAARTTSSTRRVYSESCGGR